MRRRSVVKSLLFFTGGVMILPSCITEERKASVLLNNLSVSEDQEKLLAEVAETIIPQTDTPGAKQMGLHLFVLKMLDDCQEEKEQKAFMNGLKQFEELTQKQFGASFTACNPKQRQEILTKLEARNAPEDVLAFYKIMKDQTIKGYLNSKVVMTELRVYELIPARYNGYFPANKALVS
ncbi:gluconate 2-dehydrogenase subunit 3 family protein [Pontibacter sp. SGAir0037]|uniref:gluconate 2-dehydrogenase subunit 3 family protein n=1 Tax=Pontibacter sp. SGAir0037 TaxID=2571030 RepID=UPI0010CCF8DC|nr:gluconate 2-dehydrogenase subunit 3 family protein [Pontibacter sp. SGAir0037]QCR21312.1 hypothetical protein C1N53_02420 [Pontibacter sp. SGAir0037]